MEAGMLRSVSVGFSPGDWKWLGRAHEGIHFVKGHELLECSLCSLGANPDALLVGIEGKALSDAEKRRAHRQRQLEVLKLKGRG
jgi:phage head maturation protease